MFSLKIDTKVLQCVDGFGCYPDFPEILGRYSTKEEAIATALEFARFFSGHLSQVIVDSEGIPRKMNVCPGNFEIEKVRVDGKGVKIRYYFDANTYLTHIYVEE
ncbi:hypothetical protein IT399_00510 [Candidatus Nomurabacteria bacterium]|nr:hypothetical protein [Candidatus Nomurabacteria bacterium]